ncbi:MAG: porin [Pseudomonadota bacterium]
MTIETTRRESGSRTRTTAVRADLGNREHATKKKFAEIRRALALSGAASLLSLVLVSRAVAAEWEVSVTGEYEAIFGYANSDVATYDEGEFDGVDVKIEGVIGFEANVQLDNGIEIGAVVELEPLTDEDQISDSYLFTESAFGRIELGARNSAGYIMSLAAPDVSLLGANDGQTGEFVPYDEEAGPVFTGADLGEGTLNSTFIENGGNSAAQRFTYFTPRIAGFQLGLSYARDPNNDDNTQVDLNDDPLNNIFDVGVNFVDSFGDIDVGVSGRWGIAADDSDGDEGNPQIYAFGAEIGFAGVTIGGSFSEQNNAGASDGTSFDAGIAYETGPWAVSFTYLRGENFDDEVGNPDTPINTGQFGNDETLDQFVAGINYNLAEGVDIGVFGAYIDFDEDTGDEGGGGDDVDGFIIGTGIAIAF